MKSVNFSFAYKNIIHKYNYISVDNYEADDIIGVLTKNYIKIIKFILSPVIWIICNYYIMKIFKFMI